MAKEEYQRERGFETRVLLQLLLLKHSSPFLVSSAFAGAGAAATLPSQIVLLLLILLLLLCHLS